MTDNVLVITQGRGDGRKVGTSGVSEAARVKSVPGWGGVCFA